MNVSQLTTTQFFQSIKESLSLRQVRDISVILYLLETLNQQRLIVDPKIFIKLC